MSDIRVRVNDKETKRKWKEICNEIDPDASYEDIVLLLYEYFDEDESRYDAVKGDVPQFR